MQKKTIITNIFWRYAERSGAQGVSFVVSMILARLLLPEDYGLVAIVTVITTVMNVFVDSGFANALVQKKDADNTDFSTVFYTNIAVCLILYALTFLCAPLAAWFYSEPKLTPVIRVLGLTIIISGVKNVQQAYVARNLLFKRFFFATLGGTIGAAVLGITTAMMGFGVWALVIQQLFNQITDTMILWFTVRWRPTRAFSMDRLKGLFSFGSKFLAANLLNTAYDGVRQLILGKMYSSADLAFYNRGERFPQFIMYSVNSAIDSVMHPTMAQEQSNIPRLRTIMRRAIKTSACIMIPAMVGMAAVAPVMIRLILTEKWSFSVPYLRVFCIAYMFKPIITANSTAIKATGRSSLFLETEVQKKVAGMLLLLISMWFGPLAMAYSFLVGNIFEQIILARPNKEFLGYGILQQITDILPSLAMSLVMGVVVLLFPMLGLSDLVTLSLQIVVGIVVYAVGSYVFKLDAFVYVLDAAKSFVPQNKNL